MKIKIAEIEDIFKEVFQEEDGVVKTVETIYERPKKEDADFLKLVISIHGLSTNDTKIKKTNLNLKK